MGCDTCVNLCERRGRELSPKMKTLCSTQKKYADIWDKKFGIVDETIVPDSHLEQKKPKKKKSNRVVQRKKAASTRTRRHAIRSGEPPAPRGLGDKVEKALSVVGVTEDRVSQWLGRPCGCAERKRKLNKIGAWASKALFGEAADATEELKSIIGDES